MGLFDILFTFVLIGWVSPFSQQDLVDYKEVCGMSNVYKSLDRLLKKEESFEDCEHSVGFHLTKDFCNQINSDTEQMPRSLTAYLSDDKIVMFIENAFTNRHPNDSVWTLGFKSLRSLKNKSKHNFTVIWIKKQTEGKDPSHVYKIGYLSRDNIKKEIKSKDLQESLRNDDQILLNDIKTQNEEQELNITLEKNQNSNQNPDKYTIEDSYLIFCLVENPNKQLDCKPIQMSEHAIGCDCGVTYQLTTSFIIAIFWIVLFVITLKPVFNLLSDNKKREKTDFPMTVGCNQRTSNYEYVIGIRFAKGSTDFDLKDVNVDLEFKTDEDETVGTTIRFKAVVLEEQPFTTIRIFMIRLTKMPDLKKIRCRHSGQSEGRIIILNIFVFPRRGNDDLKLYKFNQNFSNQYRTLPMNECNEKDEKTAEDKDIERRIFSNYEFNYTYIELIWILFVNISLIGFAANFLIIALHERSFHTLSMMFITTIASSLMAIVFNFVFLKVYEYLRFQELKEQYDTRDDRIPTIFWIIRVFYIISILSSVAFGITTIFLRMYTKNIWTYEWFCSVFCASVLFVFVWNLCSHLHCIRRRRPKEKSVPSENDEYSAHGSSYSSSSDLRSSTDSHPPI